jgi:hypothetical protein
MTGGNIIVECYGDGLLINQLGYKYLAVHSGIGQVAKQMNQYFNNRFALGIYDGDKTSVPTYFTKNIKANSIRHNVQLIKCEGKFHYGIKIIPAFEGFITEAGRIAGLSRVDFKLPGDEKQFRNLCKDKDIHKNQRMVNFVNAVIKKNPPPVEALKEAIEIAFKNRPK